MAANLVFVDGTLTTGLNDGTSWENAYQGATGLQTALDNVSYAVGTHTYILLRNTFTLTTRIDVDAWTGSMYYNTWLRIIGCQSGDTGTNYTPLPIGQYVEIDASGVATDAIRWYTIGECVSFENLWVHGANTSGYAGFYGDGYTASKYYYVFKNVKVTDCYHAFRLGSTNTDRVYAVHFFDCVFMNLISHVWRNDCLSYIQHMSNCYVEIPARCAFWYPTVTEGRYYGVSTMLNNVFSGGMYVFYLTRTPGRTVANNVFYNQTDIPFYVVHIAGMSAHVNFYNNIAWLADPARPVIKLAPDDDGGAVIHCDYNATNSTNANKWGVYTPWAGDNNIQLSSDPFTDAANGDFGVNSPALLRGGRPDYMANAGQIGAVQRKYQFPNLARMANLGRLSIVK